MNTTLMILFLLLPSYPSFIEIWQADRLICFPETPESEMSFVVDDAEIRKLDEILKTHSDPVTRSRIVFDIGKSCNANVFSILEEALTNEKDPAVRADILTAMANIPVVTAKPANRPHLEIRWQPAHPDTFTQSLNSGYLPEKLAAARFLKKSSSVPLVIPDEKQVISEMQKRHFSWYRNPGGANTTELLATFKNEKNNVTERLEAIRAYAAQKKLPAAGIRALQTIATEKYIALMRGSTRTDTLLYDNEFVRAAAYMALVQHRADPAAAAAAETVRKKLEQGFAQEPPRKFAYLREFYRQIELYRSGAKTIVPAVYPHSRGTRTFRFLKNTETE